MIGKLFIIEDGVRTDVYGKFGVYVTEGGYKDLVAWPPLKAVAANDWPEEDGSDPDLSDPRLDTRTFSINFGCAHAAGMDGFIACLAARPYHTFEFAEIGLVKTLRLVSQPSLRAVGDLASFGFQFADDLCGLQLSGELPAGVGDIPPVASQGYFIDGLDLATEYGITVAEGTLDSLNKAPAVKQNLTISASNDHGVVYDEMHVFFQEQKAAFKLFLHTPGKEPFWACYNKLLGALAKSGERLLYLPRTEEYYFFYYESSSVSRFVPVPGGGIWCEFTLNLAFTSYRPGQTEMLLATEDGLVIETEDSDGLVDTYINMVQTR